MSISKIQSGDAVKVIAGAFKGTLGVVTKVIKKTGKSRVSVDTIKKIQKYQKANAQYGMPGQMTMTDRFIDSSNVMLVNDKGEISRSKVVTEKGKKVRKLSKSNKLVTKSSTVKADDSSIKKLTSGKTKSTKKSTKE
jgi:ribosomal protein L24